MTRGECKKKVTPLSVNSSTCQPSESRSLPWQELRVAKYVFPYKQQTCICKIFTQLRSGLLTWHTSYSTNQLKPKALPFPAYLWSEATPRWHLIPSHISLLRNRIGWTDSSNTPPVTDCPTLLKIPSLAMPFPDMDKNCRNFWWDHMPMHIVSFAESGWNRASCGSLRSHTAVQIFQIPNWHPISFKLSQFFALITSNQTIGLLVCS